MTSKLAATFQFTTMGELMHLCKIVIIVIAGAELLFLLTTVGTITPPDKSENKTKSGSIPPKTEFWKRNYIKGGEWPEFLIAAASASAVPVYGENTTEEISRDCDAQLEEQNISFSNTVTYLAAAKAGSRTVRDSLCGCNSDPKLGYSHHSIPNCMKPWRCMDQHHGHRCSIRQLEERGAKHIIVPVREPRERIRSLSTFQADWYKRHVGLVGEDFIDAYDDVQSHESALGNLSFAWQSYAYYFLNATGKSDLGIVCVGDDMVAQYNYAIQKMAGGGESKMMFYTKLSVDEENQYKGFNMPQGRRTLSERVDYPEIKLEQKLWDTYCQQ